MSKLNPFEVDELVEKIKHSLEEIADYPGYLLRKVTLDIAKLFDHQRARLITAPALWHEPHANAADGERTLVELPTHLADLLKGREDAVTFVVVYQVAKWPKQESISTLGDKS